MERKLNLVLMLSLEEMALRRVVISLWNETDVLTSMPKFPTGYNPNQEELFLLDKYDEEWKLVVEDEVKKKVAELLLPEVLKKRMMLVVRPVGLQILEWIKMMTMDLDDERDDLDKRVLEHFCWTSAGLIDYKKTAKRLTRLRTLDVLKRFKLACTYCLADYIPILWEELPVDYKECFNDENINGNFERQMEFYWAYALNGEESKLRRLNTFYDDSTYHEYFFKRSAIRGNKVATEYFFQKLTHKERDNSLINTACYAATERCDWISSRHRRILGKVFVENLSDVSIYLLSMMNPKQQMQAFERRPAEILKCFLDWPWQDLFFDIADVIVPQENLYETLRDSILICMKNLGYYFPDLLQKYITRIPRKARKTFLSIFSFLFPTFAYAEDKETIKVVFRNIDLEEDRKYLIYDWFRFLLKRFKMREKWHLFEMCLREASLSEEESRFLFADNVRDLEETFKGEELINRRIILKRCFELPEETEESAPNN